MDKKTSVEVSALIGSVIAGRNPVISWTDADLRRAGEEYGEEELAEMRDLGLIGDDFSVYYVIREFLSEIGLGDFADGDYILEIFKAARRLDSRTFLDDPYLRAVKCPDVKRGKILLTNAVYRRGEIFAYDMPDFTGRLVVPKLGFFDREISFPALYEGVMPWVSVCPSEVNSMKPQIDAAHGRVLVLGLGLGYYAFMVSRMPWVSEVTIVEISAEILRIFRENILPRFEYPGKIRLVHADAIEYMKSVSPGDFDFLFADIWEGAVDGAPLYRQIRAHEPRLPSTEFTYWIEPQIKAYLEE